MERKALITSLVFHGLIAAICIIGLPRLKTPPLEIMQPIPIDIMELGPVTTTTKVADGNIAKPPEPTPAPPQPATPPQQKETPAPPKPPEPKPTPKPVEKPVPEEAPDADIPKAPPKKDKPEKPKDKPVDDSQQFSSLLKNLAVEKPAPSPTPAVTKTPPKAATPAAGSAGVVSDHLTISEEDALRRQIEQCWNVPSGGRGVADMIVELHIEMNPDRTVKIANINNVSVNDAYGRAIAESALRAVLNPKCSPFNLPADRFEMWREMTLRFNPKDML